MSMQCGHCGAPVRNVTICKYCDTPVPPPLPASSGPAVCSCGVIAARRCNTCDSPVCEQHTDRFWPGLVTIPLTDDVERGVWDWATRDVSAHGVVGPGATAACTMCRATYADEMTTAIRGLPSGLTVVEQGIESVRLGVASPALMTRVAADDWMVGFVAYLRRVAYPVRELVTKGAIKRKGPQDGQLSAIETTSCWAVPLDHSARPLFFVMDERGWTAGWMNLAVWHGRCKAGRWIDADPNRCFPFEGDPRAAAARRWEGDPQSRRGQVFTVAFAPPDPATLGRVVGAGNNARVAIIAGMLGMVYRDGVIARPPPRPIATQF